MRNIFCKMLHYNRLNLGQEESSVINQIYLVLAIWLINHSQSYIHILNLDIHYTTDLCMTKYALVLTAARKSDLL